MQYILLYFFSFSFLDEIYQCEYSFERIFLGAIFGSNAPFFIAGWRSDFLDQVKTMYSNQLCLLQYMLRKMYYNNSGYALDKIYNKVEYVLRN